MFGDNPIQDMASDHLGRRELAVGLTRLMRSDHLDLPLTIAINGGWGEGKTSFLHMMRDDLSDDSGFITVDFDAWAYADEGRALWRALFLNVAERLERWLREENAPLAKESRAELEERIKGLIRRLYQSETHVQKGDLHVNWKAALPFMTRNSIRAIATWFPLFGIADSVLETVNKKLGEGKDAEELASLFQRQQVETFQAQITSLEQFRRELRSLADELLVANKIRLVVFVDDLDRCLPEAAVTALEGIKVFLDMPGTIFVLAVDPRVIQQGIKIRYGELIADQAADEVGGFRAVDYLDKIIQLPVQLATPTIDELRGFVSHCLASKVRRITDNVGKIILTGTPPNPRSLKRTVNMFLFAWSVFEQSGMTTNDQATMAKIVVMRVNYPDVFRRVVAKHPMFGLVDQALATGDMKMVELADFPERLIAAMKIAAGTAQPKSGDFDLSALYRFASQFPSSVSP